MFLKIEEYKKAFSGYYAVFPLYDRHVHEPAPMLLPFLLHIAEKFDTRRYLAKCSAFAIFSASHSKSLSPIFSPSHINVFCKTRLSVLKCADQLWKHKISSVSSHHLTIAFFGRYSSLGFFSFQHVCFLSAQDNVILHLYFSYSTFFVIFPAANAFSLFSIVIKFFIFCFINQTGSMQSHKNSLFKFPAVS